eukprot:TRINITY_DN17761_c0_g1_i1.p2 TRINITY_DN17761_c0_g1~~TRINITY_DN17761_c0_g1_i1.p2  ORF type:complete len:239 (+),score=27.02 TRINITY_DN17761_c0_g1_i1:96-719(+)
MAEGDKNILSCDLKIMKYILFAVNFLFFVLSVAIAVATGLSSRGVIGYALEDVARPLYGLAATIMVISFAGCYGAWKESKIVLSIYALLMFVIIAAQVAVGVWANGITPEERVERVRQAWERLNAEEKNRLQDELSCCGLDDPSDEPDCTAGTVSCLTLVTDLFQENLRSVASVALGIGVTELLGVLFSCCLVWRIRKANVMTDGGV